MRHEIQQPLFGAGAAIVDKPKFQIEGDICKRKHRGTETSVEADKKLDKTAGRMMVMEYLEKHGTGTLKEVCDHYGKQKNEMSGRFTELGPLGIGIIKRTGEKRSGCFVWAIAE